MVIKINKENELFSQYEKALRESFKSIKSLSDDDISLFINKVLQADYYYVDCEDDQFKNGVSVISLNSEEVTLTGATARRRADLRSFLESVIDLLIKDNIKTMYCKVDKARKRFYESRGNKKNINIIYQLTN
jgi:hypothetical protein